MTNADHTAALIAAFEEYKAALDELEQAREFMANAEDRFQAADGRMRQLARIEVEP
mgnify:CR=1 FL=1